MQQKQLFFSDLVNSEFFQLLIMFGRSLEYQSSTKNRCNKQLESAIEMFHRDFSSEINIKEYANGLGMSLCWFSRCFKERFDMSPQAYLTNIRLNKAKELLLSSDYNINEISSFSGFNNPFYFSRIFKKHTDYSPTEYRKKHTQGK